MLLTIARSARVTAAQAHAAGKAMRVRLFFVPLLLFALACSGFAQVDHALIKNKPDAPLHITEAHCGQNAQGSYCSAALEFGDTTNGTVWGDSKSPSYLRMMANRKAAKEGSQKAEPPPHPLRWQKPREPSVSPELARALRLPCRARDLSPSNIARCDRGSEPHEQGYTLAQVARLVRVPQRDRNGRSQRRFSGRGALPGGLVVFP